ncbi:MAG: N-formylglutamate amidohydrolase [Dongiaceae bacterium]
MKDRNDDRPAAEAPCWPEAGSDASETSLAEILTRREPLRDEPDRAPLVVDSPHSGRHYPDDFDHRLPHATIRRAEDAWVDELFGDAPRFGASFLAAEFPRAYVDPNRHEHDIDAGLIDEPLPDHARPTYRSEWGLGVVRRVLGPYESIYSRRLTLDEIHRRVETYHRPYHAALGALLEDAHRTFGRVYHLNCHSMRSMSRGQPRPDFVLSDLDGSSCAGAFTEHVRDCLQAMGHSVALNDPFKGGEIVHRYGRPAEQRHSLQIEIRRGLYMDERRVEKNADFMALRNSINRLLESVAGFARDRSEITPSP